MSYGKEFCHKCNSMQPVAVHHFPGWTSLYCAVCNAWLDTEYDDEPENDNWPDSEEGAK